MDNVVKALQNECELAELYSKASNLYNNAFDEVVKLKQSHIDAFNTLLQGVNLACSAKDDEKFNLNGEFMQDLVFLIERENENIAFYNEILADERDEKAKDLFYLFQAHSYNDILPALQGLNSLNSKLNSSNFGQNLLENALNSNGIFNELTKGKEFLDETAQTLERLKNKQLSQAELESFLRKLNFSLLGGAVLGAGLAFMFNEISNQYTKD